MSENRHLFYTLTLIFLRMVSALLGNYVIRGTCVDFFEYLQEQNVNLNTNSVSPHECFLWDLSIIAVMYAKYRATYTTCDFLVCGCEDADMMKYCDSCSKLKWG